MAKRGVNKVVLIGTLGRDPETRYMQNGDAVCNISIATSEVWKDKQTGEQTESTEWHRVVLWRKLGEISGQYLKKGAKVYVEGKLSTRKWTDKDGIERYQTEIVADNMQMLDRQDSGQRSERAEPSRPRQSRQSDNDVPFDDDIPF